MFNFPKNEEKILRFWREKNIFQKSIERRPESREFTFYDGPPFATGLPHYGHLIAGTMKDVVPRYFTMKGCRVKRKWGWDCHGLPVEYEVEKELGISGKRDIEEKIGIAKFNEACRSIVLRYTTEWEKTVERTGRWADMKNAYRTLDLDYMETIWWVMKTLWNKGLVYESYKILPFCPRCSTPLSNFETNMPGAYQDAKDPAITVRIRIKTSANLIIEIPDAHKTYLLIWTTTPWTLPSNSGAAVGPEIDYVIVEDKSDGSKYILAEARVNSYYQNPDEYRILRKLKGKELVGLEYEPLFPYFKDYAEGQGQLLAYPGGDIKQEKNAFRVVAADFVSTEEGTGIVHLAPAFGEDDFNLGQKEGLPMPNPVNESGHFTETVRDYAGLFIKNADEKIIQDLKKQGKLVKRETVVHPYPHCWRCETPLLYKAVSSWFLSVTKIKDQMIRNNEQIRWVPEHLKYGRFGKWLEEAKDYAFSRNRYWGNPLPIWRCEATNNQQSTTNNQKQCGNIKVVGSIKELEKLSGQKITDLHKHFVDEITFKCEKCGGRMKRVPEVLDCWLESGSMPYAQSHYPFNPDSISSLRSDNYPSSKTSFTTGHSGARNTDLAIYLPKNFPAQFVAEGIDQTRGWFYTLLVIGTALFNKPPFLNVAVNGLILAEDGRKMSKRLKNYPEPEEIMNKYGADALRYYLLTSPAVRGESLCFSEKGVAEIQKKVLMLLWNIFEFWNIYAAGDENLNLAASPHTDNVLDKWVLAKLNLLIKEVTEQMENYELLKATKPLGNFINELSTWYLRRSRDRFKNLTDRKQTVSVLGYVLFTLGKLLAPFTPFISEELYQRIAHKTKTADAQESVHLEKWPTAEELMPEEGKILDEMARARKIVELALAIRAEERIKIRQPLNKLVIVGCRLPEEIIDIVKDEINVKKIEITDKIPANWPNKTMPGVTAALDIKITPGLRHEGILRELIRAINALRKEAGLTIHDWINVCFDTESKTIQSVFKKSENDILLATISKELKSGREAVVQEKIIAVDGEAVWIGIKKVVKTKF